MSAPGPLRQLRHRLTNLEFGQFQLCLAAAAIVLLSNLQSQRVFVPTMIFVIDQSNRAKLVGIATVVFLSIALIGLLVYAAGVKTAAFVSTLLLISSLLIVQFASDPDIRWVVAAVGVAVSGWLIVLLALLDRRALALAIPVAFWLDLTLRTLFDTIDLAYMTNSWKTLVVLLQLACLALCMTRLTWPAASREQDWHTSIPLAAIGPGLTAFALIGGNLGLAAVTTGNRLPTNYWLLCVGPLLSVSYFTSRASRDSLLGKWHVHERLLALLFVLAGSIGVTLIWTQVESDLLAALAIVLFSTNAIVLTMTAVASAPDRTVVQGVWHTTAMITLGMCLHAALVFLYFASSGSLLYPAIAFALLAAAALLVPEREESTVVIPIRVFYARPVLFVVTMVMALVMASATRDESFAIDLGEEITVVTYNIQNGFSADNVWDLEATARTIESLEPDIVLLQEIGRGWFAMGWADQVWWLSNRLGMDHVFGPASHDDLWGNAILSAAPLLDPEVLKYTASQNLHRSVVSVEIPVPGGTLWVASTHLDNPAGAGSVRMEQTDQLLQQWGGNSPAVIGGDFNAQPDSDVVAAMIDAGFIDSAAAAGDPQTTSESGNRIDYVFVTPDLTVVSADAPDIWTSDHRPIRVEVVLVQNE